MQLLYPIVVLSLFTCISSAGFRSPWAQDDDKPRKRENVCESDLYEHFRRSTPARELLARQDGGGGDGGIGVGLGSGNVNAGIGNINITVGNVTVSAGDVNVEDITIGNITVLVNVNLAGLAQLVPNNISLPSLPSLPAVSVPVPTETTETTNSLVTVSPTPIPSSTDDRIRLKGRQVGVPPTTVSTGDLAVGASVGNISLSVGNINVTLGSITLKNISIGNILVLVNLGTQDNLANLTNIATGNA